LKPAALFPSVAFLLAATFAVFPPPPAWVERFYSSGAYPAIQSGLTTVSNLVPFALIDAVIIIGGLLLIVTWIGSIRVARKKRSLWPILNGFGRTVTILSVIYLWFVAAWGLNYARPPLESKLHYDATRVTPIAVRELAERAVREANRTYQAAHDAGFQGIHDSPPTLVASLQQVEHELGRPRATLMARPKTSLLSPFYRAAGVSGMCAPFFLETLLNPDLTGPERSIVLAHEWAHLSGFNPESDASYVGYLAALGAGPAAEYSAWLNLVSEAVSQLQPVTQQLVVKQLAAGPRADEDAIRARLKALVKPVERVAWSGYDKMLKSQGVEEGVRSYSRVIQLLIGTDALKSEERSEK